MTDFFKNILNLEEVPFDEAERIAEPVGPGEGKFRGLNQSSNHIFHFVVVNKESIL